MLIRLSQSDKLAVDLDELKARIRVDTDDDNETLEKLIRSETSRYEDFTGRIMLPTELEFRVDGWYRGIGLPVFPIRSVSEVAYLDADHVEQVLDPTDWYFSERSDGGVILTSNSFSSPTLSDRPYPVRVRFMAGYDDPTASGSGDDPALAANENDQRNIMRMVQRIYEIDEPMPDGDFRRYFGNRKIFR